MPFDQKGYNKQYYERNRRLIREQAKEKHLEYRERENERSRWYHQSHKPELSLYNQKKLLKYRLLVFKRLGNKCERCGIENFKVLQIDHRFNDGAADRKKNKSVSGYCAYKRLLELPDLESNFSLLCANCHAEKTFDVDGYGQGRRKHRRLTTEEIEAIKADVSLL